jgi:hypothetical protein
LLAQIDLAKQNLQLLDSALHALDEERVRLLAAISDPPTVSRLRSLTVETVRATIADEAARLARLRSRFARDTVNIGVIGRARQGKSQLLQSMSGLSDNEIPSGSGSHCTGVRSTILHDMETSPHGEVTFYDEMTFVREILAPYYRFLRFSPEPRSLKAFSERPLPSLPDELQREPDENAKYKHLKTYHDSSAAFSQLLGSPVRRIPIKQIREYVAQDTPEGERIYFNYLAVHEVKIYCRFPHDDIGRIALIDMPGLGDTGIGDEERLIRVLGNEVDFVLFVKMPKATGDFWAQEDVDLFKLARRALSELPLDLWSFMILNRIESGSKAGGNETNCRALAAEIEKNGIFVAKCIVANCMDPSEIGSAVLDQLLEYLTHKIATLDQQYTSVCQSKLASCQSLTAVLLDEAASALGKGNVREGEWDKFDELFKSLWDDLTGQLEDLLRDLRLLKTKPNQLLLEKVEACIQSARTDTGIPSLDDIERAAKRNGAYNTAFNNYLHTIRTHLVSHFVPLEDTLRLSLESVRAQVADVLKKSGRLDTLADSAGTSFLRDIGTLVPKELQDLKSAFETLAAVELTYRGFLQYRMRDYLDWLHPDGPEKGSQIRVASSSEGVRQALGLLHDRVIYQLDNVFEKWAEEPNRVAVAIVEEFVDRVLRSEKAYEQWRSFYRENRSSVWRAEFDELGERSRLRQDWEHLIQVASTHNQRAAFTAAGK